VTARFLTSSLVWAFCVAMMGCQAPGRPGPEPEVPRPDSILNFTTLYNANCSACHGANGMNGPSYPLANPEYQAIIDEQRLRQVITHGEPGTAMPAFADSAGGTLTDQQVEALVHGIRAAWYKPDALNGTTPPSYQATRQADTARGQQVYNSDCASCHGAAGQEGKSKAGSITDPAFLSLISDQALRTIVIAGRPDIGQPDWRSVPGSPLTDQDVTDVVGWLGSQRPGSTSNVARGGSQ
jgi:cytochrome c oxidase cbb3-type subunit III